MCVQVRIRALLGVLLVAGPLGCEWGGRRVPPEDVLSIPGITVLEYDGLDVRVRCPQDSLGTLMAVNSVARREALLRPGNAFVLLDSSGRRERYRILVATEDKITLARTTLTTLETRRDGVNTRTDETVISVVPYDHEKERERSGERPRELSPAP